MTEGPLALGARLAEAAGLPPALSAEPLPGGRNNRVFRLALADERSAALKIYFRHPDDRRDRLGAEWEFLEHARRLAAGFTPKALARDAEAGAALYGFVEGRRLPPELVDASAVETAAEFIRKVASPGAAKHLRVASEACFSISEHVAAVDRRVRRLETIDAQAPGTRDAAHFVTETVRPAWERVRDGIWKACRALGLDPERRIGDADIIASPSDFGFHNALRTPQGLVFLDFEYAGRDDPAKLVCDFFCQPELPVALAHHELFLAQALDKLDLAHHRARVSVLLDGYRIKWIAIILNDFLAVGGERRDFAKLEDQEQRRLRQLALARRRLDALALNT
ncbi:MAG: aminoglycoside phosphotransferase family protein [Methylocystis sp.]